MAEGHCSCPKVLFLFLTLNTNNLKTHFVNALFLCVKATAGGYPQHSTLSQFSPTLPPLVKTWKITIFVFQNKDLIELAHCCLLFWDCQMKRCSYDSDYSRLDSTQMQLSPSYLHFCHKVCSLFSKQTPLSLSAACDLIYSPTIWNDLFTQHRRCRLGGFCASVMSRQFNLPSPLCREIFFNTLSGDAKQITWHDILLKMLQMLSYKEGN